MEGKLYNKKIRTYITLVYMCLFTGYLVINRVVPLIRVIPDSLNAVIFAFFAGFGGLLVLQDVCTDRFLFKAKGWWALALYIIVLGISSIINLRYGLSDNIKTMVWFGIHFFLFYAIVPRMGDRRIEKFIRGIFFAIAAIWTLCVCFSIAQYVFQVGYRAYMHDHVLRRQGFIEKRLFGLFSDPNAAAVLSTCLIFFGIYLMETEKSIWKRTLCVLFILVHFSYIILSGSRTSELCLFVAGLTKICMAGWNYFCEKRFKWFKTIVVSILIIAVFTASYFEIFHLSKKAWSYAPRVNVEFQENRKAIVKFLTVKDILGTHSNGSHHGQTKPSKPHKETVPGKYDADTVLDRDDIRDDNMLNNRLKIWGGYVDSLSGIRLVFGLSPRNAIAYIEENCPGNYVAQAKYIVHSDYVGVLAYTGIAGVAVALMFIATAAAPVVRKFRSRKRFNSFYMMVAACLCGIVLFGFSYMDVLFTNTITGVLFWMLLSVAVHYDRAE